jgi:hypothetical protein
MSQPKQKSASDNIDMTFTTSPNPRLALTFARAISDVTNGHAASMAQGKDSLDDFFAEDGTTTSGPPFTVNVSILPNANILIGNNNIVNGEAQGTGKKRKRLDESGLASVLDTAADLNVWVQFIRSTMS